LHDNHLVYLDHAATSWPKPEAVYRAVEHALRTSSNPGRSGHRLSVEASRLVFDAREAIAELLGVGDPRRIAFTANATGALNLALKGCLRPGDHVITTSMEHNSVIRPLRSLEEQGVEVSVVPANHDGTLDPGLIEPAFRPNSKLLVVAHASNVVGVVQPLEPLAELAHRHGCLLLVDAAQSLGAWPLSVDGIDMLAFTGHKALFGPQGTGGLYLGKGIEDILSPLIEGGTGSRSSQQHQPEFLPDKYEGGTPNTPGLAGLAAGVRFILNEGITTIREHEEALTRQLLDGLREIPGVTVYGPAQASQQVAVVSFTIESLSPAIIGQTLDEEYGVLCRVGLQCAPLAHQTIGTYPAGTVRLSPGYFTTPQDISFTLDAVQRIARDESK
jgi:cysteine desulfurase family protein